LTNVAVYIYSSNAEHPRDDYNNVLEIKIPVQQSADLRIGG